VSATGLNEAHLPEEVRKTLLREDVLRLRPFVEAFRGNGGGSMTLAPRSEGASLRWRPRLLKLAGRGNDRRLARRSAVKNREVAVRDHERQHRRVFRCGDFRRELFEVSFPIPCEHSPAPSAASRPRQRELLVVINWNAVRHIAANADCLHPKSHARSLAKRSLWARREPPLPRRSLASPRNTGAVERVEPRHERTDWVVLCQLTVPFARLMRTRSCVLSLGSPSTLPPVSPSTLHRDGIPRRLAPSDDNNRGQETQEGYRVNNVLASYAHLHLASNPALAAAFVDQYATFRIDGGNQAATADLRDGSGGQGAASPTTEERSSALPVR
jgi:hypothetical protein